MAEFVEVMRQYTRMCKSNGSTCNGCELEHEKVDTCRGFLMSNPARAEKIIMKWAAEHPEKTMKDVFFEKFPNAPRGDSGEPECCPRVIGFVNHPKCNIGDCCECWSRPAPEGY